MVDRWFLDDEVFVVVSGCLDRVVVVILGVVLCVAGGGLLSVSFLSVEGPWLPCGLESVVVWLRCGVAGLSVFVVSGLAFVVPGGGDLLVEVGSNGLGVPGGAEAVP